ARGDRQRPGALPRPGQPRPVTTAALGGGRVGGTNPSRRPWFPRSAWEPVRGRSASRPPSVPDRTQGVRAAFPRGAWDRGGGGAARRGSNFFAAPAEFPLHFTDPASTLLTRLFRPSR